jgi:hypothetical protein
MTDPRFVLWNVNAFQDANELADGCWSGLVLVKNNRD